MINKSKKIGVLIGLSALPLISQNISAKNNNQKMNILLFLVDDLRGNTIGCMGNELVITPNIDQLAKDGILFSNASVTTSISMVSRASILTGQYMSGHKINKFGVQLSEQAIKYTYPSIAKDNGYYTGHVGKYGIGRIRKDQFDYQVSYEGYHWIKRENGDSIHVTEKNKMDALRFLKNRPKEDNFVLNVNFFAVHAEDNNPEQYLYQPSSEKYYSDITIPPSPLDNEEALNALPHFLKSDANEGRIRWYWRFDTPERYQKYMKAYYRMLTEVDLAIGEIIKELKAQNIYDNTLIIFMGDNGYFLSDRKLADKWYPYSEALSIPLIIHDPRLDKSERGLVNDEFVLNVDIAPTILSAIGCEVPERIQGEDISPLYLSDEDVNWRKEFFYEHPTVLNSERIPACEGIIRHDARYIWWPEYDYHQFFNLETDVFQLKNEALNPEYKERIIQMREAINNYKTEYTN